MPKKKPKKPPKSASPRKSWWPSGVNDLPPPAPSELAFDQHAFEFAQKRGPDGKVGAQGDEDSYE